MTQINMVGTEKNLRENSAHMLDFSRRDRITHQIFLSVMTSVITVLTYFTFKITRRYA
jgi:hypothetical protein